MKRHSAPTSSNTSQTAPSISNTIATTTGAHPNNNPSTQHHHLHHHHHDPYHQHQQQRRRPKSPVHPSRPPYEQADDDSDDTASQYSVSTCDDEGEKKVKPAQSFEALFNSERLSDFLLDVNDGEYVFHAHKMIVGLKSERLAALITTSSSSSGGMSTSLISNNNSSNNNSNSVVTGGIPTSNTTTFTAGTIKNNKEKTSPGSSEESPTSPTLGVKPTLHLHETAECGAVFGRFLYFIYSGAVWLHRDYVLPLHALSIKYGVAALAAHCDNYIRQLLARCLHALDSRGKESKSKTSEKNSTSTATCKDKTSSSHLLPAATVCDVLESGRDMFREETQRDAFTVLARRFPELSRSDRWSRCAWTTVRDLLRSDACACEENIILVAATDWMKRTRLQDKARIQELLSSIRYPRLPRRVLYHLHTTASFRNFPPVQALIEAAIRYHCFRDVPEARDEFTGRQYRPRAHTTSDNAGEHVCSNCRSRQRKDPTSRDHTSPAPEMVLSNSSSSSSCSGGGGGGGGSVGGSGSSCVSNDITREPVAEWGCYGEPAAPTEAKVVSVPSSDRSAGHNGDKNNNMNNHHHHLASSPPTITDNGTISPDLLSDSRHQSHHHHPHYRPQQHQHVVNNDTNSHVSNQHSNQNHHRSNHQHHHGCCGHQQQHSSRSGRHHHGHHRHNHQQQRPQQQQQTNPSFNQHHLQHNHHYQQQQHHHPQQQQQQQQQQHQQLPMQCRTCNNQHQGSPVATVQPRVHTPSEISPRETPSPPPRTATAATQASSYELDHLNISVHAIELASNSSSMGEAMPPPLPPPFTRV